jgi:hypothetical protein
MTKDEVRDTLAWANKVEVHGDNVVIETFDKVTFDNLAEASALFGTKAINVGSEEREGGYCETCRYSYSVAIVTVVGVGDQVTG